MEDKRKSLSSPLAPGRSIDPLTGLGDNTSFEGMEYGANNRLAVSLFLVDLDGFGLINEAHGREVGDRCLRKTAAVLSKITRGDDFLARVGADRFAIVSPGCVATAAVSVAHRIKATLSSAGIRACVGHATAQPGERLATTVAHAEEALADRKNGIPQNA